MALARNAEDENYFVGIDNPIELRREVLEASKKLVETLKKFEAFREKRDRKLKLIEKMRSILADIGKLNSKLRSIMPKANARQPRQMLNLPERPAMKGKFVRKSPEPQAMSEMEKLENELR